MIFEHVDNIDYLEFILTAKEIAKLRGGKLDICGPVQEFPKNSWRKFKMNIFIRKERDEETKRGEEDYAIEEGEEQNNNINKHSRDGSVWISAKTSHCRGFNNGSQVGRENP